MLKMFKKNEKKNKGFTLVELIIVIAILAVLVGILAPQYVKYVEKSRKSADANNIDNVVQAIMVASADDDYTLPAGTYTVTLSENGLVVEDTTKTGALTAKGTEGVKTGALTEALIEYMGETSATYAANKATYSNTKLKSKKWGADESNPTSIVATATVSSTGSVSVAYSPDNFAEYVGVKQ